MARCLKCNAEVRPLPEAPCPGCGSLLIWQSTWDGSEWPLVQVQGVDRLTGRPYKIEASK
jgi:hypothetical protein